MKYTTKKDFEEALLKLADQAKEQGYSLKDFVDSLNLDDLCDHRWIFGTLEEEKYWDCSGTGMMTGTYNTLNTLKYAVLVCERCGKCKKASIDEK